MPVDQLTGRQLQALAALDEERHFGRAAARLGVSQPSFSQLVRRVEDEIGTPLFTRRPRVAPTEAGERFIPQTHHALAALARGFDGVERLARGAAGRIDVTFASSAMLSPFPDVLRRFRAGCPDVDLRLRRGSSGSILETLGADAHVGVLRYGDGDPGRDFRCISLHAEPFVVALPAGDRREGRKLALATLAADAFVSFPRVESPHVHDHLFDRCRAAGFEPRVTVEADDWLTILGLVDAGLGIALVPDGFRAISWGGVTYARLTSPAPESRVIACHRTTAEFPLVERFLGFIRRRP